MWKTADWHFDDPRNFVSVTRFAAFHADWRMRTLTGYDMRHVIRVHACAAPKLNPNRSETVVPSSFALPLPSHCA